jgi:hypothetical protein
VTTSKTTTRERTTASAVRLRIVAAGVALAILAMAACTPRSSHVDASPTPLGVSQCSEFACEG